jgi:hypothetical protein
MRAINFRAAHSLLVVSIGAAHSCGAPDGRAVGFSAGPGCVESQHDWDPCRRDYRDCMSTQSDSTCHAIFEKCVERVCAGRSADTTRASP